MLIKDAGRVKKGKKEIVPSRRDNTLYKYIESVRPYHVAYTAEEESAVLRNYIEEELNFWKLVFKTQYISKFTCLYFQELGDDRIREDVERIKRLLKRKGSKYDNYSPNIKNRYDKGVHALASKLRENGFSIQAMKKCVQAISEDKTAIGNSEGLSEIKNQFNRVLRLRNDFVQSNILLVISLVCSRYYQGITGSLTSEDLIEEGVKGLLKALERFSLDKEVRFSTYAGWWIGHDISRALENRSSIIRIPVHTNSDRIKIVRAREFFENQGLNPTQEMYAKRTGFSLAKVKTVFQDEDVGVYTQPLSLDEYQDIGGDRESGSKPTKLMEVLLDDSPSVLEAMTIREKYKILHECIDTVLTPRERFTIRKRFGLGDDADAEEEPEKNLREIGECYGVSRERIRQIERAAMCKLTEELSKVISPEECR